MFDYIGYNVSILRTIHIFFFVSDIFLVSLSLSWKWNSAKFNQNMIAILQTSFLMILLYICLKLEFLIFILHKAYRDKNTESLVCVSFIQSIGTCSWGAVLCSQLYHSSYWSMTWYGLFIALVIQIPACGNRNDLYYFYIYACFVSGLLIWSLQF